MADRRLSVIVPTRNEAAVITELLRDLRDLCRPGDQVILADGGSSDGTAALAGPYVDACIQAPAGRATQMNAAAAAATGEVLWFVHADSRVDPRARPAIEAALAADFRWGRFDVRLSGRQAVLRLVERMINLRSRVTGIATGDQGIFVCRGLFEQVGGFPAIPLMEDIVLSKRLGRHGRPACLRQPRLRTSSRRWERHGVVRTVLLMWWLRLAFALGVPAERLARQYR